MQVLIAFVVMGLIGVAAVVLVAAAALIRFLPLLLVVVLVVGAVRWWDRRPGRRPAPCPSMPARPTIGPRRPPPRPTAPYPDAWVLVPVWMDASGRPQRRPVIDAEVISVDEHHG